ncbi:efflux RND transporter permease subunit [Thermostilla marina]
MLAALFNRIIRLSLENRVGTAVAAILLVILGVRETYRLPIDVFPDLNRPRVVVMVEAPGLAPEEVETLITFPIETALNGATGVQAVRTSSASGLAVIYVEFDWGTDIFNDRQIVAERLALVSDRLPEGVRPQLAPIASIMGQIMIIAMWSEDGSTSPMELRTLADWVVRQRLRTISGVSQIFVMGGDRKQFQVLVDPDALVRFGVTLHEVETALRESNANVGGGYLDEQGPNELIVRGIGRLKTIDDVRDIVVTSRGGRPVVVGDVARVIEGPQTKRGDSAAYARGENGFSGGRAVLLTINKQPGADTRRVTMEIMQELEKLQASMPADIRFHPEMYQQKQFIDLAIRNVMEALRDGAILVLVILFLFLLDLRTTFITLTAIPLSILATALVFAAFGFSINTMTLGGLAVAVGELVDDAIVGVENVYRRLKENRRAGSPKSSLRIVFEANAEIRGSIVFGTFIVTLAFVPVFVLGGLEGRLFLPLGTAYIVSLAASLVVSLTITPVLSYWLLATRWGWPVAAAGIATAVGIGGGMWWLPRWFERLGFDRAAERWSQGGGWTVGIGAFATGCVAFLLLLSAERLLQGDRDGFLLRLLKGGAGLAIRFSTRRPRTVLAAAVVILVPATALLMRMERDFLPPFDEGAVQINVLLPPGTSLATSQRVAADVERRLMQIDDIQAFVRKTGRAELDEHAVPVSRSEFIATLNPHSGRSREEVLGEIREALHEIPGIVVSVEQPLAHLISHMLSGVQAQVAIKIYGDDLETLRQIAEEVRREVSTVPGVVDLQKEQQIDIPQLRIEIDGARLKQYGLRRADVYELVETALQGKVVSEILSGRRSFDLMVRLDDPYREDIERIKRLPLTLPGGGQIALEAVAEVYESSGPNTINREKVRRRIAVQCNTAGRGLVDVVEDIRRRLDPIEHDLPVGYMIEYGGQFESQASAAQSMAIASGLALLGMFMVLYTLFRSANLAFQVLAALPAAFIGSLVLLTLTHQTLSVAAMVGFISLCGIASRNGILLIDHYLHLVAYEGKDWTPQMIERAGKERVAPVFMTALTSGMGLFPLMLAAGEPGKEILYPVATVIIGGLISSTVLEFFVRPALFQWLGIPAAKRVLAGRRDDVFGDEKAAPGESVKMKDMGEEG